MYNISDKQKGIQSVHTSVRYCRKYNDDLEFIDYADNHETVIFLSGGTSGDMKKHFKFLTKLGVKCTKFNERDLNNSLSSICLVADESVYDRDKYFNRDINGISAVNPATFQKRGPDRNNDNSTEQKLFEFLKSCRLA
jgi:hypothetical protein